MRGDGAGGAVDVDDGENGDGTGGGSRGGIGAKLTVGNDRACMLIGDMGGLSENG